MLLEQEFIYLEATNNEMFVGERKDFIMETLLKEREVVL